MITVEFITALFYEVDEQLRTIPKHPQGDRILSCSGEHRQQVVFVETTEQFFLSQAHLPCMLLTQQIKRNVSHRNHIFRGMVLPDAAAIFIERDI
jgi:hypothetical protein